MDSPSSPIGEGPLAGIRVVDLTAMLAGPFATMLLSDLGADVVKIEPPTGDTTRAVGPLRSGDDPAKALGGYFQSVNRGKRSIVLDLKTLEGHDRLLELVRAADVVVENFSAGVMERLELSYERLAIENPRIVYAALRGFGDRRSGKSPYEQWPALDVVAQAMGGYLGISGTAEGVPVKSGPGIGDIFPGALLALGIVSAVRHAESTGRGQFVDIAMYDAMLAMCERMVYQHSFLGVVARPQGNGHPLLSPFDILPTADGWIAVAAPHERLWQILVDRIGLPELASDPRYIGNAERAKRGDEVRALIGPWFAERTNAEIVDVLGGLVPVGPVNDARAIFADPHVHEREMLVEVEQPGSDRPVTIVGSPLKLSGTPSAVRRRAPLLGEDDLAEVLKRWSE